MLGVHHLGLQENHVPDGTGNCIRFYLGPLLILAEGGELVDNGLNDVDMRPRANEVCHAPNVVGLGRPVLPVAELEGGYLTVQNTYCVVEKLIGAVLGLLLPMSPHTVFIGALSV